MSTSTKKLTTRQMKIFINESKVKFCDKSNDKEYLYKVYSNYSVNGSSIKENICDLNFNSIQKKRLRSPGPFTRSKCKECLNNASFVKKNINFEKDRRTKPVEGLKKNHL